MADAVKGVYDLVNSEKKKESSSIEPKEFFWDQFIKYIASAILALSVLNVTVEFLRGGGVSCFPPSDNVGITAQDLEGRMLYEFGRGQTSYINNYCARNVPNTEYFPIYILIHGLLLIVPHYIWNALHNGDFDSFFLIVDKLDRLRDSTTGEYDTNNFDRVTKLEQEYSGRKIYYTYILKLVLQLIIVCGSVILSALYFKNFSFVFFCPGDSVDDFTCPEEHLGTPCGWPLNVTVPCVYTSLRVLNLVRYADFFLLTIAAGLVLYALGWCAVRHTEQLGYFELAKFSFQSCLKPDHFVFPPVVSWPTYPCFTTEKNKSKCARRWINRLWPLTHYLKFHPRYIIYPGILHDLDFLLLMLFRADTSHGQVFKDIQTSKELKRLLGRDHQLLHLYISIQQDLPDIVPSNDLQPENTAEEEEEEDIGCCSWLTSLFCGNQNRSDSGVPNPITDQPDGQQQPEQATHEQRATDDFHRLFHTAGFNGNAEKIAYERFKPHLGRIEYQEEYMKGIRDVIFWFVTNFGPHYDETALEPQLKNDLALDISFGSIGYSLIMARPFVKVLSVNFQPHYQNTSENPTLKDEFYTNYVTFKFPDNLYSQSTESITGAQSLVLKFLKNLPSGPGIPYPRLDFIVIAPITEESKLVSVNLFLNALYGAGRIGENAILLAIRPLKIGATKVQQRFFKYEPSKLLFDHKFHNREVNTKIAPYKITHVVDGFPGIKVDCGSTPCIFEMIAYKYVGKIILMPEVTISRVPQIRTAPRGHNSAEPNPSPEQPPPIENSQADSTDTRTSFDSGTFSPTNSVFPPLGTEQQAPSAARRRMSSQMSLDPHEFYPPAPAPPSSHDKNRVSRVSDQEEEATPEN